MIKNVFFFRPFLTLFVLFFLSLHLEAQQDSLVNAPNLLMPRFTRSIVKLNAGGSYNAVMNYDMVDQQMVVLRKGQYFVLNEIQAVDTIYMANRIFIPFENVFYEVLVNAPVSLFMQHKMNMESEGATTAYGAKSTTAGVTHIKTIYGNDGAISLKMPDNVKLMDDSQKWIRKDGIMHRVSNQKQFLNIFKESKGDLSQFISRNKIDFKKSNDLVRLVTYVNEQSR